ncbi:MAG: N-glycosylase/DNA lyase [Candidatus Thermoplasmatota archaeon]|jgi:N-glycosylase/DNA lyase|nr:N-glycosylase/DNA lyase [Candidatus Thermoplasmatota archaeon]MDP7266011.1 N-glycosylase/DNA lyase [Candidatus Thermoplasmatota archaeon]
MKNDGNLEKRSGPQIQKVKEIYGSIRFDIESRLQEFEYLWTKGSEENVFHELVFCLLTPQSSARVCWETLCSLIKKNILNDAVPEEIAHEINRVRFKNNKSRYIVGARDFFTKAGNLSIKAPLKELVGETNKREWLVNNIKGIGYKEASHFLRNIGMGREIAILDRHILRNLVLLGVIEEIPKTLSRERYLAIEQKMADFATDIKIPLDHLDLVLWYKEKNEIFK